MRIVFIILLVFSSGLFSQGFTWERSSRMPFQIPKLYFGGSFSAGQGALIGETSLFSEGLRCCDFEDGSSSDYAFGGNIEYWYKPKLAFNLGLNLNFSNFEFNRQQILPYYTGEDIVIDHSLNISNTNFAIVPGAKYRVYDKLNLGLRANLLFNLTSEVSSNQTIQSPQSYFFRNGTKRLDVENPEISEMNNLLIIPEIIISYDFQLNYPIYLTPFLSGGLSLNSLNSDGLRLYNFRFGIDVFYGN